MSSIEGKGNNYFYDYSKSEFEKVKYNNSKYSWKNIGKWWSETHTNPDGSKTKWQPKMKKYGLLNMDFLV